jgi:hypothetical protein
MTVICRHIVRFQYVYYRLVNFTSLPIPRLFSSNFGIMETDSTNGKPTWKTLENVEFVVLWRRGRGRLCRGEILMNSAAARIKSSRRGRRYCGRWFRCPLIWNSQQVRSCRTWDRTLCCTVLTWRALCCTVLTWSDVPLHFFLYLYVPYSCFEVKR